MSETGSSDGESFACVSGTRLGLRLRLLEVCVLAELGKLVDNVVVCVIDCKLGTLLGVTEMTRH